MFLEVRNFHYRMKFDHCFFIDAVKNPTQTHGQSRHGDSLKNRRI